MRQELKKQRGKGIKTVPESMTLSYGKSVDIWALGKILDEFIQGIPLGKASSVHKELALRLVREMIQNDPSKRPAAADCLKHPWMTSKDSSDGLLGQKRSRSFTPASSSSGQPCKKVNRMTNHQNGFAQVLRGVSALSDGHMASKLANLWFRRSSFLRQRWCLGR